MKEENEFKDIFLKYFNSIIIGVISGLVVFYGLKINNGLISAIYIFLFAILMAFILSIGIWIDKNKKKPNKYQPKKNLLKIFLFCIVIIAFSYFFVLFFQWQFALFHEAGHLQACKMVNISCKLEGKSFPEYLSFTNYNLLNGIKFSKVMGVIPSNISEFCNLQVQQQQLIRVGGFRRDIIISFILVSLLIIEFILFIYFLYKRILTKKKTSYKIIMFCIFILFITSMILYLNLSQLQGYFSKNLGDLFYFPCN